MTAQGVFICFAYQHDRLAFLGQSDGQLAPVHQPPDHNPLADIGFSIQGLDMIHHTRLA